MQLKFLLNNLENTLLRIVFPLKILKNQKEKKKSVQKHKRKIEMFIMEEENKNMLLIYINQLRKAKPSIEMDIKESLVNKRMKIP